jgi:hypothetical protein
MWCSLYSDSYKDVLVGIYGGSEVFNNVTSGLASALDLIWWSRLGTRWLKGICKEPNERTWGLRLSFFIASKIFIIDHGVATQIHVYMFNAQISMDASLSAAFVYIPSTLYMLTSTLCMKAHTRASGGNISASPEAQETLHQFFNKIATKYHVHEKARFISL